MKTVARNPRSELRCFDSAMRAPQPSTLLIVLGPPRSFTTVVSAMLGQHPQMYGLPEVHLFAAETMAEWWRQCAEATFNMDHGLMRVAAQLFFGDQTEDKSSARPAGSSGARISRPGW